MSQLAASPTFLIGVTGGTGSGKTTLARALRRRLVPDALLLTEDAYYLPRREHTPDVTGWSEADIERAINFDDPRAKDMALFKRHLADLKAARPVVQPVYDFASHERLEGATRTLEPARFVIAEGVHVLHDPEAAALFDLTVYVDTADDLRLIRRIRRDREERGRDAERVIDQYLRFVRPAHQRFTAPAKFLADIVIADEGPPAYRAARPDEEAEARLAAPVWARLEALGLVPPHSA